MTREYDHTINGLCLSVFDKMNGLDQLGLKSMVWLYPINFMVNFNYYTIENPCYNSKSAIEA